MLCIQVVNQDCFSLSKWLKSSSQERDISFLWIWFQSAKFLIVCDFGEQSFSACKKAAVTQRKGHFTAVVCLGEKNRILVTLQQVSSVSVIPAWWMTEQMFRVQAKFYLFKQNICPHRVASRRKMEQEKRVQACQYRDVIHALIQQRLVEYLQYAVTWQGNGNSVMNKTQSLPSRNLQTGWRKTQINRQLQQGNRSAITRLKNRVPMTINRVLVIQETGKTLPKVMEEREGYGWERGEGARGRVLEAEEKGLCKHNHLGSDPGSTTHWVSL